MTRQLLLSCLLMSLCQAGDRTEPGPDHVRVAVIGGMTMTGM